MMIGLDHTHDPALTSWVSSANGHTDFPIQNLPMGMFSIGDSVPRMGIAIGDMILDVAAAREALGCVDEAWCFSALNLFLGLGAGPRTALRHAASALLAQGAPARPDLLVEAAQATMHLPAAMGDYTDFYAGIHHAMNVGKLFRPGNPLMPNYKWVPIGYHGRASSVRPSGVPVRRPSGQRKRGDAEAPSFGPSARLDYELELGVWVGPGNTLGSTIPIGEASSHIAGYCLLNDWSARDVQSWETQPLGPFLGKSFQTTVSPWIVTPEALAPFRRAQAPRAPEDPRPLAYLLDEADQQSGALGVSLEVFLLTRGLREKGLPPHLLSFGHAENLYWTPAQLLAHHASNGCNLRPGDLLGTGTISSPTAGGFGSLLEITENGKICVRLASGETRLFLEDDDEISLQAHAEAKGYVSIGFGECRAKIINSSLH
jgi:fumarylacetoacetase